MLELYDKIPDMNREEFIAFYQAHVLD